MEPWAFFHIMGKFLFLLLLSKASMASVQHTGKMNPGFKGSQMTWVDNDGLFLLSNNSNFGFGFVTTAHDVTLFLLSIIHTSSSTVVWSANSASPIQHSDNFVFDDGGNAYLQGGGITIWSTNTEGKGISAMELLDSGNLVLRGSDSRVIWQSFSHPTDTLLSNQDFTEGMRLVSNPNPSNLSYFMEMKSGDMILYAEFQTPQPYWSMAKENRKTINKNGGSVALASLNANSWRFYDQNKVMLWQFVFSDNTDPNATWVAVLGNDGFITFSMLQNGGSSGALPTKIPDNPCSTPVPCDSYYVCYTANKCQCPSVLSSRPNCKPGIISPCDHANGPTELVEATGDGLNYFALGFISPDSRTDLDGCKASCSANCSCLALFFDNSSGNCFLFDRLGSFQSSSNSTSLVTYVKVSSSRGSGNSAGGARSSQKQKHVYVVAILILTVIVIIGLILGAYFYYRRKMIIKLPDTPKDASEEDNFWENLSGMPIRFTYKDLETATDNFSVKLGQGGFGSVYRGVLPDGTRLAVKKLEGIGQGKREFRAEVSIIGGIHHLHLVRLRGFCAEGKHRLLAYEYMANGSLDKWIFRKKNKEDSKLLDWNTRFNIALGTAKGLAYLHEDCNAKIVHCDIKPENVLLDDDFLARVSDFGLAKLMTREQSHVFTTLRGTRGYLAPEWITSYAISEKSDVYSYGMVLLEIIGGRKNYDSTETSERSHFPSYAFKMMEEGKVKSILDSKLKIDDDGDEMLEDDESVVVAIKVALWCIQDDMNLRPSMAKVVQMLEGLCAVPTPPTASQTGSRLYSSFFKSISEEEGTSSGPSDCNSDAYLSAVRLSGPR